MKSVAPPAFGSDTLGEFDPVDYFHLGPDDPEQMPIGTAWPENTYACLEHGAFEGPPLGDLDGYGIYEQAPHGSTPTPTMSWQQPTPEIDPKIYESLGIEPPAPLDHFDQQAAHGSAQTPAMPLLHAAWPAEKTPEIDSAINASLDPPDAMDIFVGLDRGQHGTADTPTMPRQPHPALPAAPDVFFGAAFQQPLAGAPEDPGQSLPETALHSEAATSKRNRARKHRERASRIEYAELNGVTPNVAAAAILNSERSQINPAHANSQGRPNAAGVAFIQASYANNGNISEVVRASGFSRDQVR